MKALGFAGDRRRSFRRMALGLLGVAFGLSACIAVPYARQPGFRGSRADLGDAVPEFIGVGRTTRDDVLGRLGHAEVEAPDASWFYYRSHYLKSEHGFWVAVGVGMGAAAYGTMPSDSVVLARRLWVRFSSDGVVQEVSSDRAECKDLGADFIEQDNRDQVYVEGTGIWYPECYAEGTGRPIIQRDLDMLALRARMRRAMATPDEPGDSGSRWFLAKWRDGQAANRSFLGFRYVHASVLCTYGAREFGELLLTREFLLFFPHEASHAGVPAPPVRIARSSIVAVGGMRPDRPQLPEDRLATDLTLRDGREVSFSVCESYGDPKLQTRRSDAVADTDWLREQLRATAR